MKKHFSILLSLLLAFGLAGCSGGTGRDNSQSKIVSSPESVIESIVEDPSSDVYNSIDSSIEQKQKHSESSLEGSDARSEGSDAVSSKRYESSLEASESLIESSENKPVVSREESKTNQEKSNRETSQMEIEPVSEPSDRKSETKTVTAVDPSSLPKYSGSPFVVVNNNEPVFPEITVISYEHYSDLDYLGRCGVAQACIGKDLMPTEKRGSIGMVKPTGWHTVKYENEDGKYLYNRCHLIGYQLTAENANEKNLITGTRYLNVDGMLPFENLTADYIKETSNHVMYRVTPIFEGNNLLASGVQMEGYSV